MALQETKTTALGRLVNYGIIPAEATLRKWKFDLGRIHKKGIHPPVKKKLEDALQRLKGGNSSQSG